MMLSIQLLRSICFCVCEFSSRAYLTTCVFFLRAPRQNPTASKSINASVAPSTIHVCPDTQSGLCNASGSVASAIVLVTAAATAVANRKAFASARFLAKYFSVQVLTVPGVVLGTCAGSTVPIGVSAVAFGLRVSLSPSLLLFVFTLSFPLLLVL